MKTTTYLVYDNDQKITVSKTVSNSGKTKLVHSAVFRKYNSEKEAMEDMHNFAVLANKIMIEEQKLVDNRTKKK